MRGLIIVSTLIVLGIVCFPALAAVILIFGIFTRLGE